MADGDSDEPVQVVVLGRRRFEKWIRAEIVAPRIHSFTAGDLGEDVRRAVTDALVGHEDVCAVVRAEDEADIERGRTVAAERLPVAATVHDLTRQALAMERASGDDGTGPWALRCRAWAARPGTA